MNDVDFNGILSYDCSGDKEHSSKRLMRLSIKDK